MTASHHRSRRHLVGALVAVLLLTAAGCGRGDQEPTAAPTTTTATAPSERASSTSTTTTSTTTTSTTTTSTTAPPTTAPPTEPPTTTAPPPTAPPTTVPPPPPPVSVLVVGDSVGFTVAEGAPPEIPGVTSVDGRALPGCGLLTRGARPPGAESVGAPAEYDGCADAIAGSDAEGLAGDPAVVLLFLGAWERADHIRDGRTVGPGDPGWTQELSDALALRVASLTQGGARVALWVDPCAPDPDMQRRQQWFRDEVIAPVVASQPAAEAVDPTEVLCRDGLPRTDIEGVGDPRPDDGQHFSIEGAAWLWTTWLGPTLAQVGAG